MDATEDNAVYQRAFDDMLAELESLVECRASVTAEIERADKRIGNYQRAVRSLANLLGVEPPRSVMQPPPKPRRRYLMRKKKYASAGSGTSIDTKDGQAS